MIHANKRLRLEGGQVVLNDHQIDHPNQNNIIKFTKDKVSVRKWNQVCASFAQGCASYKERTSLK